MRSPDLSAVGIICYGCQVKPKQFSLGDVYPNPLTPQEGEEHIRAFVEAFIAKDFQDRWRHIMLEKPEKAKQGLRKFDRHLDARYCTLLPLSDSLPASLAKTFGAKLGVYFDGIEPPCKITAAIASSITNERSIDAIWSMVPGKLVLFFFHEGWSWKCER